MAAKILYTLASPIFSWRAILTFAMPSVARQATSWRKSSASGFRIYFKIHGKYKCHQNALTADQKYRFFHSLNIQDLQAEINAIDQEIAQIESSGGQAIVKKLLNIIERLASSNDAQESELQKLRDEINRLKGEPRKT